MRPAPPGFQERDPVDIGAARHSCSARQRVGPVEPGDLRRDQTVDLPQHHGRKLIQVLGTEDATDHREQVLPATLRDGDGGAHKAKVSHRR